MTDREYRKHRRRIRKLAKAWHGALGLGWWQMQHIYHRDGLPDSNSDGEVRAVATVTSQWEYRLATVRWSMPDVAEQSNKELEDAFVHEMMHVFVNEMREGADADVQHVHEEAVCTLLARAFIWTRAAGREDAAAR